MASFPIKDHKSINLYKCKILAHVKNTRTHKKRVSAKYMNLFWFQHCISYLCIEKVPYQIEIPAIGTHNFGIRIYAFIFKMQFEMAIKAICGWPLSYRLVELKLCCSENCHDMELDCREIKWMYSRLNLCVI